MSGCYCGQPLRISGTGRQGDPRFRPPRLGPRPYTISAVNSFRGNFVWVLWLAHEPRSAVAAKPLADSTPSDHDSPNAPATVRSVYVIGHPAARPLVHRPRSGGTVLYSRASGTKANRPAPIQAGARSTRGGVRVGVVDSLEGGFVGGAPAVDRSSCCKAYLPSAVLWETRTRSGSAPKPQELLPRFMVFDLALGNSVCLSFGQGLADRWSRAGF